MKSLITHCSITIWNRMNHFEQPPVHDFKRLTRTNLPRVWGCHTWYISSRNSSRSSLNDVVSNRDVLYTVCVQQLQNLSAEVSTVRRALLRAKEESGTHPLAPTPEESLVQILQEADWPNALTYAKQNKYGNVVVVWSRRAANTRGISSAEVASLSSNIR